MKDKLLLMHEFLNKIVHIADEEELTQLSDSYKNELCSDSGEDVLRMLWEDAQTLGQEILFLKRSGDDTSHNRRLAALTADEKIEFAEVEKIIDENRFGYHFQPIVSTTDGEIYSYEALMRPESDMCLSPFHILKYAELAGRLNDIERATFMNVLNTIENDRIKFKDRRVFLNSIPKTKVSGDDFRRIAELLIRHSDTVVVEMTEQDEPDETELNAVKERYLNMGIMTAIDDYGTGYSNVKNLLRYMPNFVKIDRSLLSEIQDNPKKRHFVREIVEFCHENGIKALAEGVETSEELRSVILLGVDFIQGFYTARPNAEILDSIPYEIRQEIRRYQQERQDGKDQKIYTAESTERVLLDRIIKDDYECIVVGKDSPEDGEVTVVGSPSLDTDIHIEIAKDFKGKMILDNVHLSNVKNRPCINLGENCNVTLVLKGDNKLNKSGIRVPEGARLTLEGDGHLNITLDAGEYYGIGNDISSKHGELVFNQSGTVAIEANGQKGICIGSGLGGTIEICQGKYVLEITGDTGVGMGAFDADSRLDITTCDFGIEVSLAKGVAIGSLKRNADVNISKSTVKLSVNGGELVALGTIGGNNADVLVQNAILITNLGVRRGTCVGALDGRTNFKVDNANFRATTRGDNSLPFGGFGRDTKVSLTDADITVKLETDVGFNKYVPKENIDASGGTIKFIVNDEEVDFGMTKARQ